MFNYCNDNIPDIGQCQICGAGSLDASGVPIEYFDDKWVCPICKSNIIDNEHDSQFREHSDNVQKDLINMGWQKTI